MDHKLATIVSAASALVALPAAQQATASPQEPAIPLASSHADLLKPIPNAGAASNCGRGMAARQPMLEEVQYGGPVDHHHHHYHDDW